MARSRPGGLFVVAVQVWLNLPERVGNAGTLPEIKDVSRCASFDATETSDCPEGKARSVLCRGRIGSRGIRLTACYVGDSGNGRAVGTTQYWREERRRVSLRRNNSERRRLRQVSPAQSPHCSISVCSDHERRIVDQKLTEMYEGRRRDLLG